jgi:peroxiredoxin (alkyl hydroperoxide reductase subunit C)
MKKTFIIFVLTLAVFAYIFKAKAERLSAKNLICDLGERPQIASTLKLKEGDKAPDFTLPSISAEPVTLSQYRGKKNVVISFVPAAWTSVCSAQWPRYGGLQEALKTYDAVLLGISVDNKPALSAWVQTIGNVWFIVLSDFWPHGAVADKYGVLRSDGIAERAIFIIDKNGVIQYARVHKITEMAEPSEIVSVLERISKK